MKIQDKVVAAFDGKEGVILSRSEIIDMVVQKYPGTNRSSVIPSDYCYNMINNGIKLNFHLFELVSRGKYKFLGLHYPYNGDVYWKGKVAGNWKNGKLTLHQINDHNK